MQESLERERAALVAREKQIARSRSGRRRRSCANSKVASRRCERRWQERADETVARIAETAERRKAVDEAQRADSAVQDAKCAKTGRRSFRKPARMPDRAKLKIEEGTRVRLKGIREPARVRRVLGRRPLRSGSRLHEDAGLQRHDVEEVLPDIGSGPSKSVEIARRTYAISPARNWRPRFRRST